MNLLGAIIAGLAGTIVMTLVMAMAPKMGMPKMDIVGMLGSMFTADGSRTLGMVMHLMMGAVFAIVYSLLWNVGIGAVSWLWGLVFGAVHWLVTGMMMVIIPMMHAGIKSGKVEAPGAFMMKDGGIMAFMGGLVGHMVFGVVVVLVYGLF